MARKEPENFYRRQQEEANRIAVKQHRALVDLVRLAKSSNEELRKMRRAFEAFAEAVNDMKVEPFKLQAFTAARAEAERTAKIAEGEHPPPLFDAKAFKEALANGEAMAVPGDSSREAEGRDVISRCESLTASSIELHVRGFTCFYCPVEPEVVPEVVPEGEPYPEVQIEPDRSKKRVETYAERPPRLGFGDVVDSQDESTAPPLVVVDEAEAGTVSADIQAALNGGGERPGFTVNLNAEGGLTNELPMHSMNNVPVELNGRTVGTADIFEDGTASIHFTDPGQIPAHHGELDLFWKYKLADEVAEQLEEALPEEECVDVSEARRTTQGYATGGYTGVSDSPFAEPQLAGIVHPGELWGTAEQLQHMRDLGLIAEGTITHETDAQLDMDRSQGRE